MLRRTSFAKRGQVESHRRKKWSGTNKVQVQAALNTMASLLLADQKDKRATKKSNIVGRYLQQHALGLAARLSEVINDTLLLHPPVSERRRCLGAMEEMIRICNSYVSIARPQACFPRPMRVCSLFFLRSMLTGHLDFGLPSVSPGLG